MNNDSNVAVVVDSAISLPKDLVVENRLFVVPLELVFEGRTYRDGLDMDAAEFYKRLLLAHRLPTTSAPTPQAFLEAFRQASRASNRILCLTISAKFSATYNSARVAAETAAKEMPGTQIVLVDTGTAAASQALVSLEVARSAMKGESLSQLQTRASDVCSRVRFVAFLDTLYYLWKGGRVPKVGMWVTSMLKIKPMFELVKDDVHMIERPRTRQKATERLLDVMKSKVADGKVHAIVVHAHCKEEAEHVREKIIASFECSEVLVSEFSPVLGAHTGPGLIGIAFWSE